VSTGSVSSVDRLRAHRPRLGKSLSLVVRTRLKDGEDMSEIPRAPRRSHSPEVPLGRRGTGWRPRQGVARSRCGASSTATGDWVETEARRRPVSLPGASSKATGDRVETGQGTARSHCPEIPLGRWGDRMETGHASPGPAGRRTGTTLHRRPGRFLSWLLVAYAFRYHGTLMTLIRALPRSSSTAFSNSAR
jgi:hypothetical protein